LGLGIFLLVWPVENFFEIFACCCLLLCACVVIPCKTKGSLTRASLLVSNGILEWSVIIFIRLEFVVYFMWPRNYKELKEYDKRVKERLVKVRPVSEEGMVFLPDLQ
jgi:hypothetical protein